MMTEKSMAEESYIDHLDFDEINDRLEEIMETVN